MVQMMLKISGASVAYQAQRLHGGAVARKVLGLAIVSSGYAVILAHGLSHAFGG